MRAKENDLSSTKEMSAKERLKEVLDEEALGERALRTILRREGYSEDEVEAAVLGVDWAEQAQRALQQEVNATNAPMLGFVLLKARGFTRAEAGMAVYGTTEPEQETQLALSDLASGIWTYIGLQAEDTKEQTVLGIFGENEITQNKQEVQAALSGDLAARCRIMASSLLASGVSRQYLQEILTEAGFPPQLVRTQLRALNPNWKKQCCMAAEKTAMVVSDTNEIQQILREQGFTPVQVAYALNTAHLRDDVAAKNFAELYIEETGISAQELHEQMEEHGFTPEQIALAEESVDAEGRDWVETGAEALRRQLTGTGELIRGPETFAADRAEQGYSSAQIELAVQDFDWVQRAVRDYIRATEQALVNAQLRSKRRAAKDIESLGYSEEMAKKAAEAYFGDRDELQLAVQDARMSAELLGSPEGLRQELEEGLFTPDQIRYIMDRVFVDLKESAAVVWERQLNQLIVDGCIPSPEDMRSILEDEGFEHEVIEETVAGVGNSWPQLAHLYVVSLRADEVPENEIRAEMAQEKFRLNDIESAIAGTRALSAEEAETLMYATAMVMRLRQIQQNLELAQQAPDSPEVQDLMMSSIAEMQEIVEELNNLGIDLGDGDFPDQ